MDLAVYVHFPYCIQRCPYCDFATEAVNPRDLPHRRYASAVVAELAARRPAVALGWGGTEPVCRTLFLGGGTPSLWEPEELGRVVAAVSSAYGRPEEVTVECNPTSLDRARASALRDAGATRLSIGVQSLRENHLRYLGRAHDAPEARAAVAAAAGVGGLRVSVDLMYGMPEQRRDELVDDARALLDLGARHVSAYALTIEHGTRFGELARKGRLPRLPDDDVAALYEALEDELAARGMEHYEVSNYAMPGERARHNEAYWRGDGYVGLGAGAVGCLPAGVGRAERYRDLPGDAAYIEACERGGLPAEERESLDAQTLVREGFMLGLRTADGVDLAALAARAGVDPREGRERAIAAQVARGNLEERGGRLAIPPARWLLADDVVARVF